MSIPFKASDSLDLAYRKTVAALNAQGMQVYEPDVINRSISCRDFGRVLLVFEEDSQVVVFLTPNRWTPEAEAKVESDLLQVGKTDEGIPIFQILSPHPVPESIAFLFGNSPVAQAELVLATSSSLRDPMPPPEMPALAEAGRRLCTCDSIEALESFVLRHRTKTPPQRVLAALGAVYGELLAVLPGLEGGWVKESEYPLSVGLRVRTARGRKQIVANPIGKVAKLFLHGEGESLVQLAALLRAELSK